MSLDYLLVGHLTADLTPEGRVLGGTVSYAARTVKAFGLRVGLLTSVSINDPLLDELTPQLDDAIVIAADSTSTFENIYTPEGRIQYIRGVAAPLKPEHVPSEWLSTPLVHLAPLTDEVDPQIAHSFKDSTVLLTLQGWLRRWDADGRVRFKPWFDPDVLRDIDIVVFSEEDIAEAPQLEAQFAGAVEHLFVTRAEHGGTYYHNGHPVTFPSPRVEVVHPTGAGDVFAGSLLSSWYKSGGDMAVAVRVAAALAAASVTRVGLESAPTAEEVQQAFQEAGV
jgi:sugar/nucleoside kinase (ribokinase family)